MRKLTVLLILLTIFPVFSYSQFNGYKVKGGAQFHYLFPTTELQPDQFSFLARGFINFELNKYLELELGGGYGQFKMTDELTKYPGTGVVSADIIPIDLRLRIAPFNSKSVNPYFYVGAGVLNYNVKEGANTHNLVGENVVPNTTLPGFEEGWTAILPTVGAGLEVPIANGLLWDMNAGFSYFMSDKVNNIVWGKMNDGAINIGTGLTYTGGVDADDDKDGLLTSYEEKIGTDPENPDTDGDGLKDGDEVKKYSTNPLSKDSDNDELNDYDEVIKYMTYPTNPDTDGDGLKDGQEVLTYKTDPKLVDTDNDGLNDYAEVMSTKTDPLKSDTDGDGLSDGDEVNKYRTNPLKIDTDGGTINDGVEVGRGTNPLDANDDVEKKKEMQVGEVLILEGINFETNSSSINSESEQILKKSLEYIKQHPNETYEISGHTDSRGSVSKNKKLSEARAQSVMNWLIANGVEASRLSAVGYGPDRPIAPNDTPDNMYKNRRIEFKRVK